MNLQGEGSQFVSCKSAGHNVPDVNIMLSTTEAVLSRNDLAILKKWSNMRFEAEILVDKGGRLNMGKIAPQESLKGGADQVLLPLEYPENWIKQIKDLKTGQIYTLEEFKVAFPDQVR